MFIYSLISKTSYKSDLLVILFSKTDGTDIPDEFNLLHPACINLIKSISEAGDFKAEFKENLMLYPQEDAGIKRLFLIGYGKSDKIDSEKFREIGYLIGKKQNSLKARKIQILLPGKLEKMESEIPVMDSIAEGILYSMYFFEEFKSDKKQKNIKAVYYFTGSDKTKEKKYKSRFERLVAINEGIKLARRLANIPSNHLTPLILQKKVRNEFKKEPVIKIETLSKKNLIEKKFRLLLSVAQGSQQDPCLIILKYQPNISNKKKIAIIGKGVTFDSGGISIKPSANMDEMKFDMAGAAATIGILKSASIIKPETELIGVIPAVENMPGGNAIKPGDIIKSYSGKTVEILNTDAEGRLILADALSYTIKRFNPDLVIDFATLTGAIMVALGDKMAGMFSNDSEISDIFKKAGDVSGDRVWPMPLLESYSKQLESKYADIVNIGGRWGGAITAAKFLENFVSEKKWVHLDIAGTANDVKNIDYLPEGATGFGPRLFFKALHDLEKVL